MRRNHDRSGEEKKADPVQPRQRLSLQDIAGGAGESLSESAPDYGPESAHRR